MDARVQRRVQRYGWDKAAVYYEQYWARQLECGQDRMLELIDLQPGARVLEVACGTGLVTVRAAGAVGPTGRVVATDISTGNGGCSTGGGHGAWSHAGGGGAAGRRGARPGA